MAAIWLLVVLRTLEPGCLAFGMNAWTLGALDLIFLDSIFHMMYLSALHHHKIAIVGNVNHCLVTRFTKFTLLDLLIRECVQEMIWQ